MPVEVGNETILQNQMWNLKVRQTQVKIVELEALFQYLDFETIDLSKLIQANDRYTVKAILRELFVQSVGMTKAI